MAKRNTNVLLSKLNRLVRKLSDAWQNREYQPGVSFCIATNGKRPQKTFLEIRSIKTTMEKSLIPYEILVSGDINNFGTVEGVQLIDTPADAHNGLLAKLRNNAAENAQYAIIVFADDDLLFEVDWGLRLLEFSGRWDWDILGNLVLLPNGGRYWDRCTYDPHQLIDYDAKSYQGTLYQSGSFWLIKKRVYDLEKWDPEIEYYAKRNGGINEDVEYSFRLQRKGFVLSFDKDNLVWHNDNSYIEDVNQQRVLDMDTAKAKGLPIPPVTERFLNLKSYFS